MGIEFHFSTSKENVAHLVLIPSETSIVSVVYLSLVTHNGEEVVLVHGKRADLSIRGGGISSMIIVEGGSNLTMDMILRLTCDLSPFLVPSLPMS